MKIIKKDVFNIAKRLRNINKNYVIVFNEKLKKYEIRFKNSFDNFVLHIPNNELNKLLIDYVFKTSNIDEVINEIEKNNNDMENSFNAKIKDESTYKLKEIHKYANSGSKEFIDGFKTNWI